MALVWQYFYYTRYYRNGKLIVAETTSEEAGASERAPLLPDGSGPNSSAISRMSAGEAAADSVVHAAALHEDEMDAADEASGWKSEALKYVGALTLVALAGVLAWYFSKTQQEEKHGEPKPPKDGDNEWKWDAQIYGWASALLYRESFTKPDQSEDRIADIASHMPKVSSRLPQIAKNRHTKCEGLSLALFLFAVMGNVTYVLVSRSPPHRCLLQSKV